MKEILIKAKPSASEIADLRREYLDSLMESQELYLELMVREAYPFVIFDGETLAGYFFEGADHTLVEYYVRPSYFVHVDTIFGVILMERSIQTVYCKSFDHLLLSCCLDVQQKTESVGYLFRDYEKRPLPATFDKITTRLATKADEAYINEINEEIFDHPHEITEVIENENMLIFQQEEAVIGFGIFQRTVAGRPEFDIGMLVNREFRRQGYGTFILRYLMNYCEEHGYRPTAGCAIDNLASRRCLERVGYKAQYRMLAFTV
jgi:RimJ/RimL family protein N-acetyltransferase